ncbi:hypothetical protein BMT55_13855 [Listeria newyorkensis]|uniref:Uncharacterized protein n=1 Tax=Listeria newyorkensis TaxID=1497681 RepID=A0ABX4XJY5_9LIST|nr:hypothetical protein [Listeria newyorkensis]PNP88951.1 hypothetical protein BMT55_13855 [Listeria newyorkensis]
MPEYKLKWTEETLMTTVIEAATKEEAEKKFYDGDRGEPDWLDSNMLDDDLEIKELKEEE